MDNFLSTTDRDPLTHLLLIFYICNLISKYEITQEKNLIKKIKSLKKEGGFLLSLEDVIEPKALEIKKLKLFDKFIVNDIEMKHFRNDTVTNKIFSFFSKKLLPPFKKKKHSKYEARFFWPSHLCPKIYDLSGLVFNKKYYTHTFTNDKYIITDQSSNIKMRENELQIKTLAHSKQNISQFTKKKIIPFPVKLKKIEDIFKHPDKRAVLKTPDDLLMKLSDFPGTFCVDVIKERYIRKFEDRTKIELSLIKVQEREWKTICIESKSLEKVFALSLLIPQENAERLTYDEFLHKYGISPLKPHSAE